MISVCCTNPKCRKRHNVRPEIVGHHIVCKSCGCKFVAQPESETLSSQGTTETNIDARTVVPRSTLRQSGVERQQIGRFLIRQKLGQGAFGAVYRAYDPQLDREVAIKIPHAALLTSPEVIQRFLREAKAAARLNHPHIVPVYDAGQDGDQHYIGAAFVDGRPLSDLLTTYRDNFRGIVELVQKLAGALEYAHSQGVVHRDVKPQNVMIDQSGEPYLLDFGLAEIGDTAQKLTHDGAVIGTPAYMSPEQASGKLAQVNAATDQYSLGIVFYELLTGQTPFSGSPQIVIFNLLNRTVGRPRQLNPNIPPDLETICLKTLSREPENRYQSIGDMAVDLGCWLDDEPIRARRTGSWEHFRRWCRRNPAVAALTCAVVAVTAIGFVATAAALVRAEAAHRESLQVLEIAKREAERADRERARADDRASVAEATLEQLRQEQLRATQANAEAIQQRSLADERLAASEKAQQMASEAQARLDEAERTRKSLETQSASDKSKMEIDLYWSNIVNAYKEFHAGNMTAAREMIEKEIKPNAAFGNCWEWHQLRQLLKLQPNVGNGVKQKNKINREFHLPPRHEAGAVAVCDATGEGVVIALSLQNEILCLNFDLKDKPTPRAGNLRDQIPNGFNPHRPFPAHVSLSRSGGILLINGKDSENAALAIELAGQRRSNRWASTFGEIYRSNCINESLETIFVTHDDETSKKSKKGRKPDSFTNLEHRKIVEIFRRSLWDEAEPVKIAVLDANDEWSPAFLSPNGELLTTNLGILDVNSGQLVLPWERVLKGLPHTDFNSGTMSHDNQLLAMHFPRQANSRIVDLNPADTALHLVVDLVDHIQDGGGTTMDFFPDGTRILTAGLDGVRLWRTDKTAPSVVLKPSLSPIVDLDMSANGRFVVSVTKSGEVDVFDAGHEFASAISK